MSEQHPAGMDRRHAIGLGAGAVLGSAVLAACGNGSSGEAASTGGSTPTTGGQATGTTSAGPLTTTSKIPVEGGAIFGDSKVVVTQPTKGDFKCFSAICTHAGCVVSSVSDKEIHCGCHGSAFSIADGSVVNGPATAPLAEVPVTVKGTEISLG